jgi:hypothetical protein
LARTVHCFASRCQHLSENYSNLTLVHFPQSIFCEKTNV